MNNSKKRLSRRGEDAELEGYPGDDASEDSASNDIQINFHKTVNNFGQKKAEQSSQKSITNRYGGN